MLWAIKKISYILEIIFSYFVLLYKFHIFLIRSFTYNSQEQIEALRSQLPEGLEDPVGPNDLYAQVIGQDRPGRVRMFGEGVSPSDVWGEVPNRNMCKHIMSRHWNMRLQNYRPNLWLWQSKAPKAYHPNLWLWHNKAPKASHPNLWLLHSRAPKACHPNLWLWHSRAPKAYHPNLWRWHSIAPKAYHQCQLISSDRLHQTNIFRYNSYFSGLYFSYVICAANVYIWLIRHFLRKFNYYQLPPNL